MSLEVHIHCLHVEINRNQRFSKRKDYLLFGANHSIESISSHVVFRKLIIMKRETSSNNETNL